MSGTRKRVTRKPANLSTRNEEKEVGEEITKQSRQNAPLKQVAKQSKVLEQEETEEATTSSSNKSNKKQKTISEEDEKRRQLELSVAREALGKKATASNNDQQRKSGDNTNEKEQIDMEVDQPTDDQN